MKITSNYQKFLKNFRVLAVNFTMDDKRFWLGHLVDINNEKKNDPSFFD